jgi:GntR family transcriptional regulator of arabinose operon
MQGKIKHREIYEHIHSGILAGRYGVGDQIPTEEELAHRFDASRVTVARALHDLERQGFLLRRRGAGSFVRRPDTNSTKLFGLITGENPGILSAVCDEISRVAQASGFSVLLGKWPLATLDDIIRHTKSLSQQYISRGVAGVIFEPMYVPLDHMSINAQIAEAFRSANIPVLLLDRDIYDLPRRSAFDLVGVDNRQGGFILTRHLISLGHHRIHFVRRPLIASAVSGRVRGYQDALAAHGIAASPDWVHEGDARDPLFARQIMQGGVDAFVCANDFEAASLIHTLSQIDVRVPHQVAVVGFNDDPYSTLLSVSLTTVRQPCAHLGSTSVKVLMDRMADPSGAPREVCIGCELIVRESCGAALRGKVRN